MFSLSHTHRMENLENKTKTVALSTEEKEQGIFLSHADAEEYRNYKKQQKISEIMAAIARSSSPIGIKEDAQRIADRAVRLHQAAVKLTPSRYMQVRDWIARRAVKVDMIIGGNGETVAQVKAYEAKLAKRMGASELTVTLSPSMISGCRYGEIKKELRKVKRAAKKLCLKVWVDKHYPYATILRLARICAEVGAQYFCVPYFLGCERIKYDLNGGCLLEISDVENLTDFKKMTRAGVGRIVTSHLSEIYTEWMKEVEEIKFLAEKKMETAVVLVEDANKSTSDSANHAILPLPSQEHAAKSVPLTRLEGSDLKFL